MARTTQAKVLEILDLGGVTEPDLTPFITAASSLVTELCADVAAYDAERLELIETWLAAHFFSIKDPRMASETAGGAGGTYRGQTGMNLEATLYGQQAMVLDTNGALSDVNEDVGDGKRGVTGIAWLGKELT